MPEQRQQHLGAVQLYRTISHLHKERKTNRTPSVDPSTADHHAIYIRETVSQAKLFKKKMQVENKSDYEMKSRCDSLLCLLSGFKVLCRA